MSEPKTYQHTKDSPHDIICSDGGVVIYANISACCTACAPNSMDKTEVTADVNLQLADRRGIYEAVDVASIRKGRSSPSPCNIYPKTRMHWFLVNRRAVSNP